MKRIQLLAMLFAGIMLVNTSDAEAFSMREEAYIQKQMKYFKRGNVRYFRRHCKSNIPTVIDWKSFKGHIQRSLAGKARRSPYSFCVQSLDALRTFCREGFVPEVKQQVTKYVCKYGGKGNAKVTLRNGVLTHWIDFKMSNVHVYLEKEIGKRMKANAKRGKFTIREMRYIKGQERYFYSGRLKYFERACKTKIPARIDWMSFRKQIHRNFRKEIFKSPYSFCHPPFATLASYCRKNSRFRARINRKVKRYVCKFGGKGRARVKLRRGTLTYWVDWKKSNIHKFLERKLVSRL